MRIKKYRGTEIQSILADVKRELGRDAVIVSTRRLGSGWPFGRPTIELTAAIDDAPVAAPAPEPSSADVPAAAPAGGLLDVQVGASGSERSALLGQMTDGLELPTPRMPPIKRGTDERMDDEQLLRLLERADVESDLARRLAWQADNSCEAGASLRTRVARLVCAVADELSDRTFADPAPGSVLAFVGPTGVGKTTTIAKLASQHALLRGQRVVLATMDTYRVGAVDQLRQYASLIGVPMVVVREPDDLRRAVASSNADLVFVDTPGRNPSDTEQIPRVQRALSGLDAQVHLVMSATTRQQELRVIFDRYRALRPAGFVFTKLDEAVALGALVNSASWGAPISYVTFGQRVPEDLAKSDAMKLAHRLLDGVLEPTLPVRPHTELTQEVSRWS